MYKHFIIIDMEKLINLKFEIPNKSNLASWT